MRKLVLGLAIATVIGLFGTAHAAANLEAALPGAAVNTMTGGFAFGTQQAAPMVAVKGADFTFVNLDPLASHDMVSDTLGLFSTRLIPFGSTAPVSLSRLVVGRTYGFHCTLHSWMHAYLTVEA